MKLHRVGRRADWDKLKIRNRNKWQKVAVRTHGIATPGNIISFVGFGLVLIGLAYILNSQFWAGIIAVGLGRILDIADGLLADKTGTKSPLGELVDASIDKLEIAIAMPVLVIANILFIWQAVLIILGHLANAIFSAITKARGLLPHASRIGKYATTAQWTAIVIYSASRVNSSHGETVNIGHGVFGVSVLLGLAASWGYAREAFAKKESSS